MLIRAYSLYGRRIDVKAGKYWCGGAWGGKNDQGQFQVHTKEGWLPKYEGLVNLITMR